MELPDGVLSIQGAAFFKFMSEALGARSSKFISCGELVESASGVHLVVGDPLEVQFSLVAV